MSAAYAFCEVQTERHDVVKPVQGRQKKTFHAKPVSGPVDYKALRKSVIGKYPKVLAHLAK